jgi:hypothetical protein
LGAAVKPGFGAVSDRWIIKVAHYPILQSFDRASPDFSAGQTAPNQAVLSRFAFFEWFAIYPVFFLVSQAIRDQTLQRHFRPISAFL